jgi:PAS domain S-box-containing protein
MNNLNEELEKLHNALAESRRHADELELLYELSQKAGYTLDYGELFRLLLTHLENVLPHDVAASILVHKNQCELFIRPARLLSPPLCDEIRRRIIATFARMSGENEERYTACLRTQVLNHPLASLPPLTRLGSAFQVPLIIGHEHELAGVLFVGSELDEAFSERQVRLLYTIANQTAASIKRLRGVLAAEQQQLKSLVRSLPYGLILLDEQQRVILTNPTGQEYLTLLAEAQTDDFLTRLGSHSLEELLTSSPTQGYHEVKLEMLSRQRIFEVTTQPLKIGHQTGSWVLIIREVTERKLREEALRESEQRYKRLLQSVTDYVYTVTVEHGKPVSTIHGENCVAVTGYTSQEYAANQFLWYHMIYEMDRKIVTEYANRLLAGETVPPFDHRIIHKDGSIRWVRNTTVLRKNDQGQVISYEGLVADITQRKLAEEALRASEERFRRLVETAEEGIWILDGQAHTGYINQRMTEMLGYKAEEMLGYSIFDFMAEEAQLAARQNFDQHKLSLKGQYDFRFRRKDGSSLWTIVSTTPIDEGQGFAGVLAMVTDITERKRAEEALQRYADRLKVLHDIDRSILAARSLAAIAQAALDYICQLVPCLQASIIEFDLEAYEATVLATYLHPDLVRVAVQVEQGISLAAFEMSTELKQGQVQIIPDIQAQPQAALLTQVFAVAEVRSCLNVPLTAEGELVGVLTMGAGNPDIFAPEHVDITSEAADLLAVAIQQAHLHEQVQRHAVELEQRVTKRTAELRELEVKYRMLVEQIPALTYVMAMYDPHVIYVSPQVETLLGFTPAEFIASPNLRFDLFHPDDRARVLAAFTHSHETGEPFRAEYRCLTRDGGVIWLHDEGVVMKDNTGRLSFLQGVAFDITDRKRAEELLSHRTEELQEVNAELKAFTYSVCHDLRAPLRAIQGYGHALREDYSDHVDSFGREYLERIVAGAQQMDTLIQDLLQYSRLSHAELWVQPVRLRDAVDEALSQLEAEFKAHNALVTIKEPLPEVMGHRATLTQIIVNLLTNAIKFVAPGQQPQVQLWAEEQDEVIRLWVEDNGIGIKPEHHEQIFHVFERLHGIETYPGTGIGLAIVRKGVARLGGRVGLESTPGEGSRFWVELPRSGWSGTEG